MTARRPVVLLVVLGFLVAAFALERGAEEAPPSLGAPLDRLAPTVAADDAPSATWYCAAGTALGAEEGVAEQVVVLANAAAEDRTATLTAFGSEAQQATTTVDVPAASRVDVAVTELLSAPWASVLVELDGGGVGVEHVLSGPTGTTAGPCSSTVSPTWYLPAGTTVLGVGHWLALFNPFPDEAVVDLTFETDTDTRTPPELQGLVVPGRSVQVVDVAAVVTVREQLATTVEARSGLVVAEQVEAVSDDAELPTSLSVALGAPAAAEAWELADGRALGEDVEVAVVVQNPGEAQAEVDVQLLVDDPATNGFVEPFELSIRPGQYAVVDPGADGRLPPGVGWWAWAESRNEVPVVAALVVRAGGEAEPVGQVIAVGSPLEATRWLLPVGGVADGAGAVVSVANPSAGEDVTVTVSAVAGGSSTPVDGLVDVPVAAGARARLELGDAVDPTALALRVDATGPVVVWRTLVFPDGRGVATTVGLVVAGTSSLPVPLVSDDVTSPTVVLDGVDPGAGTGGTGVPEGGEGSTTSSAVDDTAGDG